MRWRMRRTPEAGQMTSDPQKLSTLVVRLGGRRIGTINRLGGERHFFAFDQDYIDDPARPTLSLAFKSRTGGLLTTARPVNRRLPPFFSNLLPEGHLRAYLAQQARVKPEREFFLLAALGADLPGGVTALPLEDDEVLPAPPGHHRDGEASPSFDGALRFSLAGVQLKFS